MRNGKLGEGDEDIYQHNTWGGGRGSGAKERLRRGAKFPIAYHTQMLAIRHTRCQTEKPSMTTACNKEGAQEEEGRMERITKGLSHERG